jgi:hypothetical protein
MLNNVTSYFFCKKNGTKGEREQNDLWCGAENFMEWLALKPTTERSGNISLISVDRSPEFICARSRVAE